MATRIDKQATNDWDDESHATRLEEAGVQIVRGHGRLDGPGRVVVDGTTYVAARGVILNAGTEPAVPPIDGLADTPYWTNREVMRLTELPASLVVIGGGAIGAELAQAFARFGVRVTVVEVLDRILGPEEPESARLIGDVFRREGLEVVTGAEITRVDHDGTFTLTLADRTIESEQLLVAAGRRTNLSDVGLETLDLDPGAKVLETDERLRAGERLWADRRHHRQGRVHARVDVPGGRRRPRHPGRGRPVGGLPGGEPGDVHRPGGGLGGDDRAAGARRRARPW